MYRGLWTLSTLKPRVAATLALVLSTLIAVPMVTMRTPLQFHVGFAIPIFLCAWIRSRRFLWWLTVGVLTLTIARIAVLGPPANQPDPALFYANRVIALITLLASAAV